MDAHVQVNEKILVRAPIQPPIAATWLIGTVLVVRATEIVARVMDTSSGKPTLVVLPNPPLKDEWRR